MTAGVEGLPAGARDRLALALKRHAGDPPPPYDAECDDIADALLPVVAELCAEVRADELRAAGTTLAGLATHTPPRRWGYWLGVRETMEVAAEKLQARADAFTGPQQPTCQAPYTEGAVTWRCLQLAEHGDDVAHFDSAGHRW